MGPSLGSVAVLLSVIPGRSRGGSSTDGLPDEVSVCRPRRRLRRLYFFHSFLRRKGRPRTRGLNRTVGAGVGQRTQTLTRLMREHQQQFFLERQFGFDGQVCTCFDPALAFMRVFVSLMQTHTFRLYFIFPHLR